MLITRLPSSPDHTAALAAMVEEVSATSYSGNIAVNNLAHLGPTRARLTIRAVSSSAHGARRAASGRHSVGASWEAYRDVLTAIFIHFPNAHVKTELATYRGRADFLQKFPATAGANRGSIMAPAPIASLSI